uniref:Uncharacterized protein n=1 Tax=Sphaerodactylus townsendi TaxID=933632 RepID=A0ACB8EB74_9SAUR
MDGKSLEAREILKRILLKLQLWNNRQILNSINGSDHVVSRQRPNTFCPDDTSLTSGNECSKPSLAIVHKSSSKATKIPTSFICQDRTKSCIPQLTPAAPAKNETQPSAL